MWLSPSLVTPIGTLAKMANDPWVKEFSLSKGGGKLRDYGKTEIEVFT